MKKRIIMSSALVLTLLLLMPSISAIQINNIRDEIKQDYEEIRLDDILEFNSSIKHPMLFFLIYGLYLFRAIRFFILWEIATDPYEWGLGFEVVHPLVYYRSVILFFSLGLRGEFWYLLSKNLGWGWFE